MRSTVRDRPEFLLVGVLATLSAAAVFVATARFGIGLTPDSVVYLTGARSIADGGGFVHLDGSPVALFAPGYAAVLAVPEWFGVDLFDAARIISVVSFALTVALSYALLGRHVRSPGVRCAATTVVACSAVLLEVYTKALSESVFVPVVLLFMVACGWMLDRPDRLGGPAGAIGLTWAAFYLRYAGIVLCAVGALVLLIANWSRAGPAIAFLRASLFGALAASVPAVWMLRNIDAVGDPLGPRYDAVRNAGDNLADVAKELSVWVATGFLPSRVRVAVFVAVIGALGLLVLAVLGRRTRVPSETRALAPLVLFVVIYVGYLVTSASLVAFREIETRFLLPVFVPLVVLGAWLFERVRDRSTGRAIRRSMNALGAVLVAVNVAWFADSVLELRREGAGGYAQERWQESSLLREAESVDFSIPTYTNDIRAVELFLRRPLPEAVAERKHAETGERTTSLPDFVQLVDCVERVRLIWFEPNQRPQLYSPAELSEHLTVERLADYSDGSLYEIRPGTDSSGTCTDGGT